MDWSHLLFSFEGRIGRAPYWYFVSAVGGLLALLLGVAGVSLLSGVGFDGVPASPPSAGIAGVLLPLVCIALLWPCLAVAAKRWHDVDRSAWWILIGLIPLVGGVVALAFNGFVAGTPGANRFGAPAPAAELAS
jgi:uncharacterized membrane protein YhaH (DUF805 family)